MRFNRLLLGITTTVTLASAQFPIPPIGITSIQSQLQPDVKITYKETHVCETSPDVKSFAGYVHMPASLLADVGHYNISTFFWYFEARNSPETAPVAIYLAGGPGEPASYAVLSSESGPCYANLDGNSTTINPWSFNNHVNMLYIDHPVQTGFSYSDLINGTFNLESENITTVFMQQNATVLQGTFPDPNVATTTNTSITSAKALWHFAENWFTSFPEYNTSSNKVSVWGNSYGGFWVPATAAYFDEQLKNTNISHPKLHDLAIDTVGITNGCIDVLCSGPEYPQYRYNNTYGLELLSEANYEDALNNFYETGGCADQIIQCRALGDVGDPNWIGNNVTVNDACNSALEFCTENVFGDISVTNNLYYFDIAVPIEDACFVYFPIQAFLNQPWVQQDLGVPLNWTYLSLLVQDAYGFPTNPLSNGTGDYVRRSISEVDYLLSASPSIKVAFIFGDRDFKCNWLGGEATALAAQYPDASQFRAAGYQNITTNNTYEGGVVRQHGKFSFSRVFQSGHSVSAYQPETVYRIFMRAMFDRDIATGKQSILGTNYSSTGPESSFQIKEALPPAPSTCMIEGQWQSEVVTQ